MDITSVINKTELQQQTLYMIYHLTTDSATISTPA